MTTEWQQTREEEAYVRLYKAHVESLSVATLIVEEAHLTAYKVYGVHNYAAEIHEYEDAMERMRLTAAKLTNQDRKLLAKLVHTARAAAASINPDDETPVGYRMDAGDLHQYYRMLSGMLEEILQE